MAKLILFNKPYGVLSQFREDSNTKHKTLATYFEDKRLRVAGRLDATSEGLLILTDDGQINALLTQPKYKQGKTYWVQVEGEATDTQIDALRSGVVLKDGKTLPAIVNTISPPSLWQRQPPVRTRLTVPTCWLAITLYEGKNRQIRRMTASVGLPTLRLVRVHVSQFELRDLQPEQFVMLTLHPKQYQRLITQLKSKPR